MAGELRGAAAHNTRESLTSDLAAALAEASVTRLAIISDCPGCAGWRPLEARSTDLPGEVLRALDSSDPPMVELIGLDRNLRIVVYGDCYEWMTDDMDVATIFRRFSDPAASR